MKKGFTLIELLAVILVIALISAIVVPFVTDTVNNAKNKIYKNDIKSYGEAIKKAALAYELEHKKLPESIDDLKDDLKYDGSEITCDIISIVSRDNVYMEGCSVNGNKLNDFVYGERPLCMLVEGQPKEIGSKYQCKVKDDMEEGFTDGYYFYVLSIEDDTSVNLILDRNVYYDKDTGESGLTDSTHDGFVAWISEEDYGCGVVGDYCALNNKGPVTAINYLNNATSTWSNLENLNITYTDEGGIYPDIPITGKARLPYLSEVADHNETNNYLYDYLDSYYNIPTNVINGIHGYWTLSSYDSHSEDAWYVGHDGDVCRTTANDDLEFGVRPVINLKL